MSANLIQRELRNATFVGKKMPTPITFPDCGYETTARVCPTEMLSYDLQGDPALVVWQWHKHLIQGQSNWP